MEHSAQKPTANWSPDLDCWTAYDADEGSLFSVQPAVWSETWPTSGMTRDGYLYLRPAWVPPTSGSASSSWPTSEATTLLVTPTSQLAVNGGSQHPDKRKAGGHGPTLADQIEHDLLPTPTSRDFKHAGDPDKTAARMADRGQPLSEVIMNALLPTPTTDPASHNGHARNLSTETSLLPTPAVNDMLPTLNATDASGAQADRRAEGGYGPALRDAPHMLSRWGRYAGAVDRWARLTTTAPDPTEPGAKGRPRLAARFVEWMMGLTPGHVTDVPGLTRNDMLKALGNGVVPQQATAALREMLSWSA